MATAFNMLRSSDLIWPYVVNNYMQGKEPLPFDLLYWNADSTRMAAANHSFYLRNCYLENTLSPGQDGARRARRCRSPTSTIPIYNLATREDHIAPAHRSSSAASCFGGDGRLRAGRLRPYRRRGQPAGSEEVPVLDRRQAGGRLRGLAGQAPRRPRAPGGRTGRPGSKSRTRRRAKARKPGKGAKVLGDAPGTYVKVRV